MANTIHLCIIVPEGISVTIKRKRSTKIYHGGCIGCTSQEKFGRKRCKGCMYRKPNWSLPNLYVK